MLLYLSIYPVHIHTYIYSETCTKYVKIFFFLLFYIIKKTNRLWWLNCVWHSFLVGPTQMQHSLHALILINTLVGGWGGFQLIGRAALLLGFDLKNKNNKKKLTADSITASASLIGGTLWLRPLGLEGLPVGTSPYLVCIHSALDLKNRKLCHCEAFFYNDLLINHISSMCFISKFIWLYNHIAHLEAWVSDSRSCSCVLLWSSWWHHPPGWQVQISYHRTCMSHSGHCMLKD